MSPVPWTLATCLIAYIAYKEYPHTDMVPRAVELMPSLKHRASTDWLSTDWLGSTVRRSADRLSEDPDDS
jgi:hypothetical protein